YTRSLLSAIPVPNPRVERHRKVFYYDPTVHDYDTNPPSWVEIAPEHWVLAKERELEQYRREYEERNRQRAMAAAPHVSCVGPPRAPNPSKRRARRVRWARWAL